MKSSKSPLVCFVTVLVLLGTCSVGYSGDWDEYDDPDDLQFNNTIGETVLSVQSRRYGIMYAGGHIPLSLFERAGSDDAAITQNSFTIAQNSNSLANNTNAITRNAIAIQNINVALSSLGVVNSEEIEDKLAQIRDTEEKTMNSIAAFNSLDFGRPVEGKNCRVSIGSAAYGDKFGIGFGFTAVASKIDFSIGVAMSGNETVGKGNIGFSF